MSVLLAVILPYGITTVLLLLVWRFMYSKQAYLRLALMFLTVFGVWHLANAMLFEWRAAMPCGLEEWLAVAIIYVIGIAFYLANYTCIEGDSPSMILFTLLDEAGPDGCDGDAVAHGFRTLGQVEDRLGTMEGHGLLRRDADGSLRVTGPGRFIQRGFDFCFRPLGHERSEP